VPVFVIGVQLLNGETELCHLKTRPVCPLSVSSPLLLPVHTGEVPVTVPATVEITVTVVGVEYARAHVPPLCTTALNWVVSVKGFETNVEAVIRVSDQVENGSFEYCHLTIAPVCVPKVNVPLGLPEQMVAPPVTAPAIAEGGLVSVAEDVAVQLLPSVTVT